MMDYTVSKKFSFPPFSAIIDSLTNLEQFLSFINNFMVVSYEDIIGKSAFDIMKLAYWDLKLGNVLRVFFFYKKTFFLLEPQFS